MELRDFEIGIMSFILGIGIFIGTGSLNNNLLPEDNLEIGSTEENLNIELNNHNILFYEIGINVVIMHHHV